MNTKISLNKRNIPIIEFWMYLLYSFFHTFKFVIKKISIRNEFFLKICYAFILKLEFY